MRADTDDDGLSDAREVALSTNPDGTDTDGDGIPDGRELHHWDTDPTLHDYRPPEIIIHYARWAVDGLHSEYAILNAATDPSGVSEIQFVKEGDVREAYDFDGRPRNLGGRVHFEVGFLEASADAVTEKTVDVTGPRGTSELTVITTVP